MKKFSLELRNHYTGNNLVENASNELWLSDCRVGGRRQRGAVGKCPGLQAAHGLFLICDSGPGSSSPSLQPAQLQHRAQALTFGGSIASCAEQLQDFRNMEVICMGCWKHSAN